jgi:hypothetical protein
MRYGVPSCCAPALSVSRSALSWVSGLISKEAVEPGLAPLAR